MMKQLLVLENFYALLDSVSKQLILFAVMIAAFFPMLIVLRRIIDVVLKKIFSIKSNVYSEIIENHNIQKYILHSCIFIYLYFWLELFHQVEFLTKIYIHYLGIGLKIYATIIGAYLINSILSILVDIYKTRPTSTRVSIELHVHIVKIMVSVIAFLIILSNALNLNISTILTSFGAAAALLTFVFKDTVLGLLASLQLTFQDIIKVGDWITVPAYNADGDVELITITVVKVRNFDNTISTVPTYALLSTAVQNWRHMSESGGRRIKRSVNLDADSIKFCDQELLDSLLEISLCKEIANNNPELFIVKEDITNLTLFRHYIKKYMQQHKSIHTDNENFTFLVRHLQSTPTGVPLEIYVFVNTTSWVPYENVQSEIFEHIFCMLPKFGLRVFQTKSLEKR